MNQIHGELWRYTQNTMIVITTNGVIKTNGELVMGAGVALEAKNKIPALTIRCGEAIMKEGFQKDGIYQYGFLP